MLRLFELVQERGAGIFELRKQTWHKIDQRLSKYYFQENAKAKALKSVSVNYMRTKPKIFFYDSRNRLHDDALK